MPAIAFRKTTLDAQPNQRQAALWGILAALHLGDPALYSDGVNEWYVYDDSRITREDIAWVGAFAAHATDIPTTYHVPILPSLIVDIDTLRGQARAFLAPVKVDPAVLTGDETGNIYQQVLTDNGAPGIVAAAAIVPASWAPVEA